MSARAPVIVGIIIAPILVETKINSLDIRSSIFILENKTIEIIARNIINTIAKRHHCFPIKHVEISRRNGAIIAPIAKILCNRLKAAGLLPDTSLTTLLLKIENASSA